jgi:epoxyqueuosine reductase
MSETENIKTFVKELGADIVGVADLRSAAEMPSGAPRLAQELLEQYAYAIVLGAQWGKLGGKASGNETAIFLERAALELMSFLIEKKQRSALIIHTEDEFDPDRRIGLLSLKALAKEAGLGWQGRSLLIVSPRYGPIHRLVAVLTDLVLRPDPAIPNQCGDCRICIEKCPYDALTFVPFEDHPVQREEVLDIQACKGDDACTVCLAVCPWLHA